VPGTFRRSPQLSIAMMVDTTAASDDTHTKVITSPEDTGALSNVSENLASPSRPPSYHIIVRQIDNLKTKNTFNLNDLETLQDEVNKHLTKCQDHYLQITQLKLIHGAGLSNGINTLDSNKLDLASLLLDHDIKRAKSLSAFYLDLKKFFKLIGGFKEVEMEIQRILRGLIEQGDAHEDLHVEMEESEARMVIIEEGRITRREGWLEWLDELR
jgi:hypothetical protein